MSKKIEKVLNNQKVLNREIAQINITPTEDALKLISYILKK